MLGPVVAGRGRLADRARPISAERRSGRLTFNRQPWLTAGERRPRNPGNLRECRLADRSGDDVGRQLIFDLNDPIP
jgi:hypothetical protein